MPHAVSQAFATPTVAGGCGCGFLEGFLCILVAVALAVRLLGRNPMIKMRLMWLATADMAFCSGGANYICSCVWYMYM